MELPRCHVNARLPVSAFAILSKRQVARVEQNGELVKVLESPESAASEQRGKARATLDEHEASHQAQRSTSQTA
jgi:hypothetical protein